MAENLNGEEPTNQKFKYGDYCDLCASLLKEYAGDSLERLKINTMNVLITTTKNEMGEEKENDSSVNIRNSNLIHKIKFGKIIDLNKVANKGDGDVVYQTFLEIFDLVDEQKREEGHEEIIKTSLRSPKVNSNSVFDILKNIKSEKESKNNDDENLNKQICFKICEYHKRWGQISLLENNDAARQERYEEKIKKFIHITNKTSGKNEEVGEKEEIRENEEMGENEEVGKNEEVGENERVGENEGVGEKKEMKKYFFIPISALVYNVRNKDDDRHSIFIYSVTLLSNTFVGDIAKYSSSVNNHCNHIDINFHPSTRVDKYWDSKNEKEYVIKWFLGTCSCKMYIEEMLKGDQEHRNYKTLPSILIDDFVTFLNLYEDSDIISEFHSSHTPQLEFFESNIMCRRIFDRMVKRKVKLYFEMIDARILASSLNNVSIKAFLDELENRNSINRETISFKNNPSLYLKLNMGKSMHPFSDNNLKTFFDLTFNTF